MAILVALQGPEGERQFPLKVPSVILGRQTDSAICLSAKAVSRQHAQIVCREDKYFLEDLDSSNGTYINGRRVQPRVPVPLTEHDTVQIGPYVLALRPEPTITPTEGSLVIRDSVSVVSLDQSVYNQAPAQKLQMVLEIAQHLARTLDMDTLLPKLLDQLMRLLPHADRCLILLLEGDNLVVRGERSRLQKQESTYPYSRTVVNRALSEGIGILSEDIKADQRFQASSTLTSINLHSLICVPLICQDGRRLGVIQMDRFRDTRAFRSDDLHLLTTVCHQVAIALDNAALHAELLREERLRQELVMAREIQQGFLPSDFEDFPAEGFELFACVRPAREVSGDLYDFIRLEDGRLAFFVGDVSGKGMPAALFMVAVRTLGRHLAVEGHSPAETLVKMNRALAEDNPSAMFVTLAHGIYDPPTGDMVLASGGHHLPLLRRADGTVHELAHRTGRLLGYQGLDLHVTDAHFSLSPGDVLVFYTDGYIEARAPSREMFGLERLSDIVRRFVPVLSLSTCAEIATRAVYDFTGSKESQDDLTLFLLRRSAPATEDQKTDELLAVR
jgi:serine phosphatase RsbU (regulator of sigma subunit)/pSer/pThr/pTyr-binding forkhead associated (FHA) protein